MRIKESSTLTQRIGLIPVYLYRYCISPAIPNSCRYTPSCSEYAIDAIQEHGVIKGWWLTITRVSRCHPWGKGGYDPIPPTKKIN